MASSSTSLPARSVSWPARALAWFCLVVTALPWAGCTVPATQLVVVVSSDLDAPSIHRVRARVWPIDDATPSVIGRAPTDEHVFETTGEGAVTIPFSFGVVPPGGDAARRVEIHVAALDTSGAVTVERVARTGFVPRVALRLPMFLSASCRDTTCPDQQTCESGLCIDATVPTSSLETISPGSELRDAGPATDTSATDASVTIPTTVEPSWAFGTGYNASFEGVDLVAFDAASQDAFVAFTVAPMAATPLRLGAASYMGAGSVLARVARDGTVRWSTQWTIPGGGAFDLQTHAVMEIAEVGDDLFVCGVVELGYDDGASGLSWSGGAEGGHTWIARLDARTGSLSAVSTARMPAATDGDVWCRGLVPLDDGSLLLVLEYANFVTPEPSGVTFDGAAVALDGAAPMRARTALLRVRWDGTAFSATTAHLASTSAVYTTPRAAGGVWLVAQGGPQPSGFHASEPTAPTETRQSAALVAIGPDGAIEAYHLLAATTENLQQIDVVEGGDTLWVHAGFTDGVTTPPWWAELTGDSRVTRGSELGAGVMRGMLGRFDPSTGLFVERIADDPVPIFTRGFAADSAGNLYLGAGLGSGARVLGLAAPYTPNGRSDAYLASFDRTGRVRWSRTLTESTGEATYGDRIEAVALARDGAVLVSGSSSASGLELVPGDEDGGVFVALFAAP